MHDTELARRLDAARHLAGMASDLILRSFSRSDWRVESKSDGSPVTTADREAEQLLRREIASSFPGDGVLGEEFGETRGISGFRWVLDPIDGTASFVRGVPLFGILIGIERDGHARAGIIEMPALRERVVGGEGLGAWHEVGHEGGGERRPARVSSTGDLSRAMLCTTSLDYYARTGRPEAYAAIAGRFGSSRGWSDCYGALLLATGRVDAWIEPLVHAWDVSAIIPVIEAAGGACTDWRGERRTDSGTCAASNGALHTGVLELLEGRT